MNSDIELDSGPRGRGCFAPSRLTIARHLSGLSKKSIADYAGVTGSAVTQYEGAIIEPKDHILARISELLGFPVGFFHREELSLVNPDALTFRSRRSMTASLREKATAYSVLASEVISPAIRLRFKLPDVDVPDLSDHSPEEAGSLLRGLWRCGEGPISNMVHALEGHGVEVYWIDENAPSVFAFSRWKNSQPFVFLNVHCISGERGRFDAAHELGHLVLHRDENDLDCRQVEHEADCFAASFLLPFQQFRMESPPYPHLSSYLPLKRRWGVSIAAMIRRSRDTGVISQWQYECACKELSVKRWRVSEPEPIGREQSRIHDYLLDSMSKRGTTPEVFAYDLGIPIQQLQSLMPLAFKYHEISLYGKESYDLGVLRALDDEIRKGGKLNCS